jgi:plastocyanin
MRRLALLGALILTAAAMVAAVSASAGSTTKKVGVYDNYFDPVDVKIHKGDKVKWVWKEQFSSEHHNVTLKKGPDGVKKFHSQDLAYPATYKHKFTKKGKYKLWCTLHPQPMRMTVTVKR